MRTWIALLRAVNLGPSNKIPMAGVRDMLAALGFAEVRTLLASGNALFAADEADAGPLEAMIEAALAEQFGLHTDVIVRSPQAWSDMVAANPFPAAARDDPAHLVAMPLKAAPADGALEALQASIIGREQAAVVGANCYLVYPDNIGDSKLTIAQIDRRLGLRGTGRNWNTVLKIAAAAA